MYMYVYKPLSERETEILLLIDKGMTNIMISQKLCISEYTVETHRKNINNKLGTSNPVLMLNAARERGLL
jgi:DNA-binding NarL/FixJ family response regulator